MANIFPKYLNTVPLKVIVALLFFIGPAGIATYFYYITPEYSRVGYQPIQPVLFKHSTHVDQVGMDCRFCHTYVDRSEHANIPDSATCMICHDQIGVDMPAMASVRESVKSGKAIPWIRVHKLPDYAFFNHAVHVNRGVGCVECHGKVNEMDVVYQAKSLSMSFCLECHRNPKNKMRKLEDVYDLNSMPLSPSEGARFIYKNKITPSKSCSACHL